MLIGKTYARLLFATMSQLSPTVSVVVSAYAETDYLSATIGSILQQTFSSWEIIVFNHDFNRVIRWLKQNQDSRFKFIWQKNAGFAQTFNRGILEAKGKYICLLEAGDLWHPDKLRQQKSYLDRNPETGLVASWSVLIDRSGKFGEVHRCKYSGWVESEILKRNQLTLASVMLRRSCFGRVGLFDSQLSVSPDWDLWIRLSRHYQFMVIPQILTCRRQRHRSWAENWSIVETDLHLTIEKAYATIPAALVRLKHRSYGHASLYLAQYILQYEDGDLAIARNYCHQSLEHYLPIGFSREFLRVRLTIAFLYCFQRHHGRLLSLILTIRYQLAETASKVREYRSGLWDWMTEEVGIVLGKHHEAKRPRKE